MPTLDEGKLRFQFPEGWQAIKYDESQWHCNRMKSRLKAMDFLLKSPSHAHFWIEIKDCEGFESDNQPRLSPTESKFVTDTRYWLEQQGWNKQVKAERKKPFIVDEVEEKLRSTLAAMLIAQRESDPELQAFQLVGTKAQPLTVILLLTWDKRDFKRLATRLQQKLKRCLQPYGIESHIVNEQTCNDVGLDCQITRKS